MLSDLRSADLGCQAPTFAEGALTPKAPLPACDSLLGVFTSSPRRAGRESRTDRALPDIKYRGIEYGGPVLQENTPMNAAAGPAACSARVA